MFVVKIMKILMVTPYLNFSGGVEKMNQYLESILIELGHSVEYLTTEDPVAVKTSKWKVLLFGKPAMTANSFKRNVEKYDLVICNGEYGLGINNDKCINIFHGSFKGIRDSLKADLGFKDYLSLTWQAMIQQRSSKNKFVVTVSEYCKETLSQQGINVDLVIPNFVDTEKFKPINEEKDRRDYLFVGKYFYKGKGIDILEKLEDQYDLPITCVTDVRPKGSLSWIESNSSVQLEKVYNDFRILIFPSRFESSGLVALEAMACGVPIVMNRVGCAIELEKVIPEFVCNSNDPSEYNEKIKIIEKNYDEYSKKALDYVLKFHTESSFKESWVNLLDKIC